MKELIKIIGSIAICIKKINLWVDFLIDIIDIVIIHIGIACNSFTFKIGSKIMLILLHIEPSLPDSIRIILRREMCKWVKKRTINDNIYAHKLDKYNDM